MRKFVALILLVVLFGCITPGHLLAQKKPNILVILVDDLGYGDLSCQGAKDMKTPHLDKLFSQGMKFTQFYANCPVCSPTRASLLTGRYPELVGVPGVIRTHLNSSWGNLSDDAVLLPALLKQAGYFTAMVGKWHLGLQEPDTPNTRGFDYFQGFLGDMMDDYYHHRRHGNNYMRLNKKEIDPKGHATDLFSQWAVDFIHKQKNAKNPFFLYLAYNAPHSPVQPPPEWLQKVKNRERKITERRAKLVAFIEHMDDGIGRVLNALKESGQFDNTLIIFTSDNGGDLGQAANCGPLRNGKGSMYEGGVRVPMCAVWTGHIQSGTVSNIPAITMDITPTCCQVAKSKIKHKIEGVSLLPLFTGKKKTLPKRDFHFIRREGGRRYQGKTIHAMRRGDWKLVQNLPGAPLELFNIKRDPMEKRNLRKAEPEIFQEMQEAMAAHIERGKQVPWLPEGKKKK